MTDLAKEIEIEIEKGDICQHCKQVFMLPGDGIPRTCTVCMVDDARPEPNEPIDLDRPKRP